MPDSVLVNPRRLERNLTGSQRKEDAVICEISSSTNRCMLGTLLSSDT